MIWTPLYKSRWKTAVYRVLFFDFIIVDWLILLWYFFFILFLKVVGWGFDENNTPTEELKMAKMPVVSQQTCLWSYPQFYSEFTSEKTFCAGFRNGNWFTINQGRPNYFWLRTTENIIIFLWRSIKIILFLFLSLYHYLIFTINILFI